MIKIILILKFFLIEIKSLKRKITNIFIFFQTVSIIKLLFKIIKKDHRPIFRNTKLNEYLILNQSYWKFKISNNNKFILVDLTLSSHPIHAIIQCILSNNFRKITGYKCIAIINQHDILTKL